MAVTMVVLGMSVRISFDWLTSRASPTSTDREAPGVEVSGSDSQARSPEEDGIRTGLLDLSRAFQTVAKEVVPSVVTITCIDRSSGGGNTGGSGIIVDRSGIIVTNHHVVRGSEDPTQILCSLYDGRRFAVKELVGFDRDSDIAVLRIEASNLRAASLGDSDGARVGQWVLCIGNAEGLEGTVTHGIVSAVGRRGLVERTSTPDDLIQTDAAINRGNSGGPLVDLHGRVIGMNTLIFSPNGGSVGLGFAIPINVVRRALDDILEFGTVARGGLGVYEMTKDAEELFRTGMNDSVEGAYIGSVVAGSPADEAGVESGDVIIAFNGREITSFDRLRQFVAYTKPGTEAILTVRRGGNLETQIALKVVIGGMGRGGVRRFDE